MSEYNEHFISTMLVPKFHFLDPQEDEIELRDISHSLSLLCRYGGHCKIFYSVGEHCVRMAQILKHYGADEYYQLAALLHDAEEAYLPDIPRPVKYVMPEAEKIYKPIRDVIYKKFGVPSTVDWAIIKDFDNRILLTEAKQLGVWNKMWEPLGRRLRYIGEDKELGWCPNEAEEKFEKIYEELRRA